MDNRGYDGRGSALYASRIPPPVYTVQAEVERPRRYHERRRVRISYFVCDYIILNALYTLFYRAFNNTVP